MDGGYTHHEVEARCRKHGISQHFTGISGPDISEGMLSLAEAEWHGMELVACPAGHEPIHQQYNEDSGRFSFRMAKGHFANCPLLEYCFIEEKQEFYSHGF